MNAETIAWIRERAGHRCEYCHLPAALSLIRFEIEHVIARQHDGSNSLANLAYSCLTCNRFKGTNLSSIDRQTSRTRLVRLFNPRLHRWNYHFGWDGAILLGRTAIGRVTVKLLQINDSGRVVRRQALLEEGLEL